jgi:hypothetical protein
MLNAKAKAVATTSTKTKKGQAAKPAAPVLAVSPKAGYVVPASLLSPAAQVKAGIQAAGYTAATGYPQGTQLVCILPQPVGLTAQAQSYHSALVQAAGGTGIAHATACNVLVAALVGVHPHTPRRVLRRAVRAQLIAWQPTS